MDTTRLDQIATAHHGIITRDASGMSTSAWHRAISAGRFEQLFPGVARLPGTSRTTEQRIAAAVAACGRPALASHRSAAHLWGIPRPAGEPIDVTLPHGRRRLPGSDVIVHRPRDLQRLRPQRRDGIACTNVLRTVLDLGAVDPAGVSDAVGHVLTHELASLGALESVVIQHSEHGRTGIVALRHAVAEWTIDRKPTDSVLEQAMHRLIRRHGLPAVEFHPIICGFEVDFRVVGTTVVLECDGWAHHGLDRSGFERDRERDATLIADGWIVVRFTYRSITRRPGETAQRIAAAVARWA